MTVCIATDAFYPQIGGIATFYGNMTGLLLAKGHRIIILTISHDERHANDDDEIIEERGYTKITLKRSFYQKYYYFREYFRPGGYMAPYWLAIGAAMRDWLLHHHAQFGIDVAEVTDYGGIGFFLCDPALPPLAVTGHGCLEQYAHYNHTGNGEQVRLIQQLEKLAFQHAESIIAHSPLNRHDLQKFTGRNVDFATAPWMITEETKATKKGGYFLVVGGMQVVKGAVTMAEAIELCVKKMPDIKLHWIGTDFYVAPGQRLMSLYLSEKHPGTWNKNFIWLDEQDRERTQQSLRDCLAVVVPSDWETFNYVALEAASAGKPVILSDKAGVEYLFTDGKDALMVRGGDAVSLSDALLRLAGDTALQESLGAAAKEMIRKEFEAEQIVRERLAIYEKIIHERTAYKDQFEDRSRFLNTYLTLPRKLYFQSRALAKRILKGRS
jgi:glycosyltransferase involved in cell wall biosynthesis